MVFELNLKDRFSCILVLLYVLYCILNIKDTAEMLIFHHCCIAKCKLEKKITHDFINGNISANGSCSCGCGSNTDKARACRHIWGIAIV